MSLGELGAGPGEDASAWSRLASSGWDYSESQYWFHREVLYPALLEVLEQVAPAQTLDFGCGRGHLAVLLGASGFPCHAYDPAEGMATVALEQGLTVFSEVEDVPVGRYDAVVANAVLSTVRDLRGTLKTIEGLLNRGGHLVISIPHPVFTLLDEVHTTTERTWLSPDNGRDGVWRYLSRPEQAVTWGSGLPQTTLYHRTLGDYVQALSDCGLLVSRVLEPVPAASGAVSDPELHELFTTIPAFLVIDARL
jgi:SAM-dependent methyltransferase